ncbi:transposase [Paracoccus acridae]|uniref:Transposase n=1 Tax=Paracoccus acridae TaxID=1795310 RepID=A0ABQ1VPP4_9RHOB|nr:transposase [Paracoccus acridae]
MSKKPVTTKVEADRSVKDIRRATRKIHNAEEKIRIVLAGLRGEDSIAELCRREGIAQSLYYSWSKEFLEAGKKRLAGDTARQATSGEVKDLRAEALALKEVVADLTLENRLLKKKHDRGWGAGTNEIPSIREARDHPHRRAIPPAGSQDFGTDRGAAHDLLPVV